jgi:hypothetical protein
MPVDCGASLAGQRAEPANASWLGLESTRCTSHLLQHCRSHLCCYTAGAAPAGRRHETVVLPQIDVRGRAQPGAFGREEAGVGLPDGGAPCLSVPRLPCVDGMGWAARLALRRTGCCVQRPSYAPPAAGPPPTCCRSGCLPACLAAPFVCAGRKHKRVQRYEEGGPKGERSKYFADDDDTDLQVGGWLGGGSAGG